MSELLTQKYQIDMIPRGIEEAIHVSQYDTGRLLVFSFVANDTNFTIPAGAVVTITGTKPDNTGFQYEMDIDGNNASVLIKEQMTVLAGRIPCEITIAQNGVKVATANFILDVEKTALSDDTAVSETDLPLLAEVVATVADIKQLTQEVQAIAPTLEETKTIAQQASATATEAMSVANGAMPYSFNVTISASSWSNATYTVSDAHINSTCFIDMAPATNSTAAQMKVWNKAMMKGLSQTDGSFRLQAMGTTPTVDLRAVVTVIGGTV